METPVVDIGVAMPEQITGGTHTGPALRSLADRMNWLIDRARPAGRDSCSNAEVADLIERTTGERVSYITIWKLRNGQAANPQMKLIEAMARTFGVPLGFFFADYDTGQAGLLQEEVELLALVRNASISTAQLRAILGLSPAARVICQDHGTSCRMRVVSRSARSWAAARSACREAWVTPGPPGWPSAGGAAWRAWILASRSWCR
jgi:transcriptional regulator with XRE-family HTH domain